MRRWSSTYRFSWTPIITFGARRIRLLEWIDRSFEPTAFTDSEDHVGFALSNPDIRITLTRSGATLEDRSVTGDAAMALAALFTEALKMLSPQSVVLASASIAWSGEIPGADYEATRSGFASRLSGIDSSHPVLVARDASVLMDLEGGDYEAQVEWGIVSSEELAERLRDPSISRVRQTRGAGGTRQVPADLPAVSLFADVLITQPQSEPLGDELGIEPAIDSVTFLSSTIANALRASVTGEVGSGS
ncbi:hypothetical protein ABCS02_03905 [Microbacterium sp. X-17]|uniref:hypothetical protein n=1 Tax=Microbacterium sp. X-17 TaxID=3144404 RepID=UPI0031F4FFB7